MRSDRRALAAAATLVGLALATGCRDSQTSTADAVPERFAGVRKQAASSANARSTFCEKSYPAGGEGARRYAPPPQRPWAGSEDGTGSATGARGTAWTWVNLWATWCAPCVEEMELLKRWRNGFSRDGMQVSFEFVSIDDSGGEKELGAWRSKGLPGPIRWLRSEPDLGPLLDSFGVDRGAMIPIHALVDASGWLRCVRIGAIHEQDYAAVKGLLAR